MTDHCIVCVSGRSAQVRAETDEWLRVRAQIIPSGLYMREIGDYRPDHVIKLELLERLRGDGFVPLMAFEDRTQVVEMWRAAGITCAQVAQGDF